MNTVAITGRLGADPEMKYTPAGLAITKFSLAVNRQKRNDEGEQETDWFDVTCFGGAAETAGQYLDKGALVGVEGRLQQERWQTPEGDKRARVVIIANRVDFLETKADAERRREAPE